MIQWVVGSVVGWSVGWSFVNLIKPRKKHVWGSDFTFALWLKFILLFEFHIFLYWRWRKNKFDCQKQSLKSLTIPWYILIYMSIITSNETKRKPTGISLNIYFIYRKLLQTFRKSLCLVKEFFLVNLFIGVFWGILRHVS